MFILEQSTNALNRIKTIMVLCVILTLALPLSVYGYSLDWDWVYDDPLSVSVYITSTVPNSTDVVSGYDNWDYLSEVDTYRSYDIDYTEAYITYSSVNTGAVADTSLIGSSDWKQITIRPPFKSLTSIQRQETIAHEMGHAWGLNDIYDEGLMDETLMRGEGFNDNANPYQDDEDGIAALY